MKRIAMLLLAGCGLTACQTAPTADSGFLNTYDGLTTRTDTLRASIREKRDDTAVTAIDQVFLEPAVMVAGGDAALSAEERVQVLREVDRQVCYEVSERFSLAQTPRGAARLRVGVTGVRPTGQAASGVAAVANAFVPRPGHLPRPRHDRGSGGGGRAARSRRASGRGPGLGAQRQCGGHGHPVPVARRRRPADGRAVR